VFKARHSSDVLDGLTRLGPDEQDDYFTRFVPAVRAHPFRATAPFAIANLAYRIGVFGQDRRVLIRVDNAEEEVWFVRFLS